MIIRSSFVCTWASIFVFWFPSRKIGLGSSFESPVVPRVAISTNPKFYASVLIRRQRVTVRFRPSLWALVCSAGKKQKRIEFFSSGRSFVVGFSVIKWLCSFLVLRSANKSDQWTLIRINGLLIQGEWVTSNSAQNLWAESSLLPWLMSRICKPEKWRLLKCRFFCTLHCRNKRYRWLLLTYQQWNALCIFMFSHPLSLVTRTSKRHQDLNENVNFYKVFF